MLRDAWRLAVGTLTAVPVTPPAVVDRRRAGVAMTIAPLAAAPLGAVVAAVAAAGHGLRLPALVTALLAVGAAAGGNRAFHLDGLSDMTDGLAASYDRDRSLTVMKSGTAGPAGVTALVLVIGVQAAALAAVLSRPQWWQAAVLAGVALCASRAALALCCARGVPAARPDGLGRLYTQTVPRTAAAASWVTVAVVVAAAGSWAGLPWWRGLLAAAAACAAACAVTARAVARFGGVTGDVFGASIELALAAFLVALS